MILKTISFIVLILIIIGILSIIRKNSIKHKKQRIQQLEERIKTLEDYIDYYGTNDKNYKNVLISKIHLEHKLKEIKGV